MLRAIALLACLSAFPAAAQTITDKEVQDCAAITGFVARLDCFDKLAQKIPRPSNDKADEPTQVAPAFVGKWMTREEKSKIDDSPVVFLSLRSDNQEPDRWGEITGATLVLRCMENRTVAYFNFGGRRHMADLQSYGHVTVRLDTEKAKMYQTAASTDNEALGLWSGGEAIPFIKDMLGNNKMTIRVTPYSESPVEFEFNITGIENVMPKLQKACRW